MINQNSSLECTPFENDPRLVQVDADLINSLNEEIHQQKSIIQQNHYNIEQKNQIIDKFTRDFKMIEQ